MSTASRGKGSRIRDVGLDDIHQHFRMGVSTTKLKTKWSTRGIEKSNFLRHDSGWEGPGRVRYFRVVVL